jgi:hypothetical protein
MFFWPKQKKYVSYMILNDKPNLQVSRILINPRPIYIKRSEMTLLQTVFGYSEYFKQAIKKLDFSR